MVEGITRVVDNPPKGTPDWSGMKPQPDCSKAPYKIYNIGNNDPVTLMEFIEAIEKELGIEAKKIMMDIQPGDVPATYADVRDLQRDLGYKPETTIKHGIKQFIDWFREYYDI